MIEIQPPHHLPPHGRKVLFLAGSIEMGAAPDWQNEVRDMFRHTEWVLLNPRRHNWDSSWEQRIDNPTFREQVEWELAGLERANAVIFFFAPGTKSPISLFELGLLAHKGNAVVVVCPDGFWRKGNVDIVCQRYGMRVAKSLSEASEMILGVD